MISQIIEIEHFKEGDRRLVAVPVYNTKFRAILYEADFDDLTELGISFKWNAYHKQVVARSNGGYVSIGRLIRDADKHQKVIAKDDDPFNLRRNNLILAPGTSKYRARNTIERHFKSKIELRHIYTKGQFNEENKENDLSHRTPGPAQTQGTRGQGVCD